MKITLYKIPTLFLFFASILPIVLIDTQSIIWSISNMVLLTFFSLWIYSITANLLRKKIASINFNKIKFTTILAISLMYTLFLSVYFILTYDKYEEPTWMLLVIIIGNILLGYAYFYVIGFLAKLIATVELKKEPKIGEYIKYLICLIAFPIGIWLIAPKIKILLKN